MKEPRLLAEVREHPYPLLFATVSGAHLYGFASPDSDFDLRGVHVTPMVVLTGLQRVDDTVKRSHMRDGMEVDLVTHEARKFFRLLLGDNGYVLEQLFSPLVVHTTAMHDELKAVARGCVTRPCVRHYLGFSVNQWLLFNEESPRRLKPLLYTFRVLLSGIHLMRTGEVNANLQSCNEALGRAKLPYIDEIVARKVNGTEGVTLTGGDVSFYESEYARLRAMLVAESERSTLPLLNDAAPALSDLLFRIRTRFTPDT